MSDKKHRGRIQAQGGGLEASESWAQDEPLTKEDGLSLLHELKAKLPQKEADKRTNAFKRAERFIEEAGTAGGVQSPLKKPFVEKGTNDIRIDIEVLAGRAFVCVILIVTLFIILKNIA